MTFAQACAVPETPDTNDNAFFFLIIGEQVFVFFGRIFKKEIDKIHLISKSSLFEFN
jgi:hypothetical protein